MSKARDKANSTVSNFASTGIDDNADANAITIDSSEIVMTGKTAADLDTAGFQTASNGQTAVTRASATPFFVNRKTDDGTIIDVRKDNTTVGSIGTASGDLTIHGDVGIRFSGDDVRPLDSSGAQADNSVDLGHHDVRWQDLYLGGNLYLGGTGSANALDDYETGTWTPTMTGSTSNPSSAVTGVGTYVKVGKLVHIYLQFNNVNTTGAAGIVTITGQPFAADPTNHPITMMAYDFDFFGKTSLVGEVNSSTIIGMVSGDDTAWANLRFGAGTTRYLFAAGTYTAS